MTTTPMFAPTFSDEELARLLATMKDSDSVELKLTVAASQQRSTMLALGVGVAGGVASGRNAPPPPPD